MFLTFFDLNQIQEVSNKPTNDTRVTRDRYYNIRQMTTFTEEKAFLIVDYVCMCSDDASWGQFPSPVK